DNKALHPAIEGSEEKSGKKHEIVDADSGFSSFENCYQHITFPLPAINFTKTRQKKLPLSEKGIPEIPKMDNLLAYKI
ncbi:MAG: hypothetical protein KKD01_19950, partial [Proteobacteria bacterium]|nr:hypothetical protein [Pseudomonadota bacterium]